MADNQQSSSPSTALLEPAIDNERISVVSSAKENRPSSIQPVREEKQAALAAVHRQNLGYDRRRPQNKTSIRLWWTELLSIIFSLSCLAANVGVLAALDDQPYKSWRIAQVDVTPNAIISTIATFTKASLLLTVAEVIVQLKWLYFQARMQRISDLQVFDDASRGPLGSIRLLWRINLHSSIASLSAVITILALAAEPFTQQVLRYPTKQLKAANVTSAIGVTNALYPIEPNVDEGTKTVSTSTYLQQLNIAVNSGIVMPAADAFFDCPSASCTWPKFSSLALCNSCLDISPSIDVNCSSTEDMSTTYRLCTYSLGSQLVGLDTSDTPPLAAWNVWQKLNDTAWQPNTLMNVTQDWTVPFNVPGRSTWMDVVRFDQYYITTEANAPDNIMPTVLRCELTWCAQYHGSTTFRSGKLADIPDFSAPLKTNDTYGSFVPHVPGMSLGQLQQYSQSEEGYWIDNGFSQAFQSVLTSVLTSSVFANGTDPPFIYSDALLSLPALYEFEYEQAMADQANVGKSYSLYYSNHGNMSKTLDNVAASVTNQMRSSVGSRNITGNVEYPTVYIQVIWPWLIYPAVLSVLAAALLAVTIWLSHGHDKMVWKSSSLALLFHGLPHDQIDRRLLDVSVMEREADGIWAKLSRDGDGKVGMTML